MVDSTFAEILVGLMVFLEVLDFFRSKRDCLLVSWCCRSRERTAYSSLALHPVYQSHDEQMWEKPMSGREHNGRYARRLATSQERFGSRWTRFR